MFIRWKPYGKRETGGQACQLVESVRTDRGPRQRVIAHLGTISRSRRGYGFRFASEEELPTLKAKRFWRDVDDRLAALVTGGRIGADERWRIEDRIAAKVGRVQA